MRVLEFVDQYSFLFSLIYTITLFLFVKTKPRLNQQRVQKCLSLKKKECKIVLSSYDKKLHNKIDIIPVCPIGDLQAASNIIDLIHASGLVKHQQSIFLDESYNVPVENYNLFCIGGSLANKYSHDFFQQFFPNFKILASPEKIRTNPNKIPNSRFMISENKKGFVWSDSIEDSFVVEKDERYAIIVKLTEDDFKIKNHGTVHILFGNGIEGTLAISQYLLFNYKDLYSRVKNKKHYFIAFKLKRNTKIIDPGSFLDLSDKMFIDNPDKQCLVKQLIKKFVKM